jgi:hypothetical protein
VTDWFADDDAHDIQVRREASESKRRDRDDWEPVHCRVCGTETRGVRTLGGMLVLEPHHMPSGQPCWRST